MADAIVMAVVALLEEIAPLVANSASVEKIILALIQLLPTLVNAAKDLVQPIKNIIAALQVNAATTEEQMRTLKELDAKVDAEFEAAAAKAESEDTQ